VRILLGWGTTALEQDYFKWNSAIQSALYGRYLSLPKESIQLYWEPIGPHLRFISPTKEISKLTKAIKRNRRFLQ
jgi:hypothetical protein